MGWEGEGATGAEPGPEAKSPDFDRRASPSWGFNIYPKDGTRIPTGREVHPKHYNNPQYGPKPRGRFFSKVNAKIKPWENYFRKYSNTISSGF